MPLPKISTPLYELQLPSNGKKIKYRPFLVREEKVLILALEGGDSKSITNAVKKILKDCISTRIKIDTLPTFDIEYLFLNIRAKSVGEALDLVVTCPDDNETTVPVKVYIDEVEVLQDEDHTTDINLDGNLTLRMKYPSLEQFIENNFEFGEKNDSSIIEKSFDVIASCIDMVFDKEDSWAAADCEKFFETMPKLTHTFKVTNPNTKVESEVTLEGLSSFFD